MESSDQKRRFRPPWTVERANQETFLVKDANGITLAWVYTGDPQQVYGFGYGKLTADEGRRIANAIRASSRISAATARFLRAGRGTSMEAG
jgi:hypothetical protein